MTVVCVLMAVQGVVGLIQYENGLPAELVWIHVALATCTWLALLWSVAAAGSLAPREPAERKLDRPGRSAHDRRVAGVS